MIAEVGRLAGELGAQRVRIGVRSTARNHPARLFVGSLAGDVTASGDLHEHVIDQASAAACRFDPQNSAETIETPSPHALVPAAPTTALSGAVWSDIATRLWSVSAIEQEVRAAAVVKRASSSAYRPPENETQRVLAQIIAEAMGVDRVSIDDDFFELGVHSLLAVQLLSRIRDQFDVKLPIRTMFECPTVSELAAAIISMVNLPSYEPLVPLQVGDDAPPLFCVHPANGDAVCYMRLTKALGAEQTVYGFEASGLAPGEPLASSLEAMAATYVRELLSARPYGPYYLVGWSFGGVLAFEMARQLHEAGGNIGAIVFLDAPAPKVVQEAFDRKIEDFQASDELILDFIQRQLDMMRMVFGKPKRKATGQKLTWQQAIDEFQQIGALPPEYSIPELRRKMIVFANCTLLAGRYDAPRWAAPVVHFRAGKNVVNLDFDWRPFTTQRVKSVRIRCNHFEMGFEPNINVIADHLRGLIRGRSSRSRWQNWLGENWARTIA